MKKILILLVLFSSISCSPLKQRSNNEEFKIVVAKNFKKDLPKKHAFLFMDKKSANAFRQFMYWKLGRLGANQEENIPFKVGDQNYYLSFYERPKESTTLNVIPTHANQGEGIYARDVEYWYILITVLDSESRDCLNPSYDNQNEIVLALKEIKNEYEKSDFFGGNPENR